MSNSDKNSREKITGDSEARYREIFELFPGATFEMDKEGNIVFASQKAFESFGYNQSDLKEGLNVFQMFIPSDRERVKVNLQKRLEGNSKGMNEYTALRKDGSTFPIIAQANRIFRENEVVGLRGVIIDITERKKVEEELRSSEKKYRILFEDSPISLWEEDYSKLKIHIDSLKDSGVKDFDKYFNDNPDELIKCTRLIQVLDVNKATLVLYKAENKAELFGNLEKFFTEESFKIFKKEVTARAKGERFFETEGFAKTLHDEKLYIQLKSSILPGYENNWSKVLVSVIDISERKKAEEEIYKFKAITENANFGTAISDLNGNLTYVNKNFAAMHGYGVEEIIGKNLIIFHNEEQLIEVEKINRQLKETGGYSSKEVWHTHKDGSVFPTLMNGIVINDDKGNPSFLAATAIDITERKRAEEVLRQSKEKYQVLVENAPSVLWKTSIKGITVFISTNIKEIYGYTPEEIYADSENIWFGRIHNDDLKEVEKEFELLFSEGKNFDVEYRIKRKDGEWIWARDIANVVCSENGELFAYGVFTDITERKKAEKKLQESEENARALLNATTEIVLLINPDETVAAANESAAKGFGLTPEELVGRNLFDLMTPEVAERRRGFLRKIIEHKMPLRDEDENRGRRFDYSAFPILDDNGTLRLIALFVQDITERKRVEESLKNSETRYRLLFETSADGIIIADTETKDFKYANLSLCKMLGYKEDEIIGMSVRDIHPTDNIEHVNSEFEAQAKGEKELAKEIPCLKKDGTIIYVDISAKMTIIDGRKCNIGFFRDITERKTIEIRNKARLNLLDRLRKAKSIDECLETGCKAIYEAELYRRAVLTLHSEDRNITNLG
ncbi:MAG: PAS domain S-box protein, partial [candidate division Zixibacteria bacterium]|nr:PAS domain S-box protein [candidate division Zixibacteria bacterium]